MPPHKNKKQNPILLMRGGDVISSDSIFFPFCVYLQIVGKHHIILRIAKFSQQVNSQIWNL